MPPKNNTKKNAKDDRKSIFVDPTSDKTKGISANDFPPELGLNGSTRRVLRSSRMGESMTLPDDLPPIASSTPRKNAYKTLPVAKPIDGASNATATPTSSNPPAAAEAQPSAVRISTNVAAKANGGPTVVTAAPAAAKAQLSAVKAALAASNVVRPGRPAKVNPTAAANVQPPAANATNAASKANGRPVVVNPTAANTTGTMGTGARANGSASGRNLAAPRVVGAATAAPAAVPAAVRRPAQPLRPAVMERVTGENVASVPLTTIPTSTADKCYEAVVDNQKLRVEIAQMKLDVLNKIKKVPISERLQLAIEVMEGPEPAKPAAAVIEGPQQPVRPAAAVIVGPQQPVRPAAAVIEGPQQPVRPAAAVIEGPQPARPAAEARKRPAVADAASPNLVVVKRECP